MHGSGGKREQAIAIYSLDLICGMCKFTLAFKGNLSTAVRHILET